MCPNSAAHDEIRDPETAATTTTTTSRGCSVRARGRAGLADTKNASTMCEQCEIFYCDECRDMYHPMRGPLGKHNLVSAAAGRDLMRQRKSRGAGGGGREAKCDDHPSECVTLYCLLCKSACCNLCLTESSMHLNHQVLPINQYSKSQKVIFCFLFLFYLLFRVIEVKKGIKTDHELYYYYYY